MSYTPSFTVYSDSTEVLGKDPTTSYTHTSHLAAAAIQYSCADFNTLALRFIIVSGTAPTSISFLLETSEDEMSMAANASGAAWGVSPIQNVVSGVLISQAEPVRTITWAMALATGNTSWPWYETIEARKFRIRVLGAGGGVGGDLRLRVNARLAVR